MSRTMHIPYTIEQDEDEMWCAHAVLRSGVGAVGEGTSPTEAIEDLREALAALIEEFGPPQELELELKVA